MSFILKKMRRYFPRFLPKSLPEIPKSTFFQPLSDGLWFQTSVFCCYQPPPFLGLKIIAPSLPVFAPSGIAAHGAAKRQGGARPSRTGIVKDHLRSLCEPDHARRVCPL